VRVPTCVVALALFTALFADVLEIEENQNNCVHDVVTLEIADFPNGESAWSNLLVGLWPQETTQSSR